MRDLTKGPIMGHLLTVGAPIAIGMFVQTLYVLVDLYFVSRLGSASVAGVSAGGTVFYIVLGLTQMISIATTSLMARAVGAKDQTRADQVFNQALGLSLVLMVATLSLGYAFSGAFVNTIAADDETYHAGVVYLYAYLPGLALQFVGAVFGSALRAAGVTKPTMVIQIISVLINMILAPILIAGWGTGHLLGVFGAGLSSTIAIALSTVLLLVYFMRSQNYVYIDVKHIMPRLKSTFEILKIGLPAGGEFMLMSVFTGFVYWLIRDFGADAQAGFAIAGRVMQVLFLPALAISFAVPAVAGQNFGARQFDRMRETLVQALKIEALLMFAVMLLAQISPESLIGLFAKDAAAIAEGSTVLRILSWNFIATGLIFASSGMFQALGNTVPSLISSMSRLLAFVLPCLYISHLAGFQLVHIWYISVASNILQAIISLIWVHTEMNKRLGAAKPIETA